MNNREGKRARVGARKLHQNIDTLANHIAGIMSNPDTPAALYNGIVDYITSYEGKVIDELIKTPEFIKRVLEAAPDVALDAETKDEPAAVECDKRDEPNNDALARAQQHIARTDPAYQRKITPEEAAEFVEWISNYDDDALIFALIRIMNGIMAVLFEPQKVEEIVMAVKHRAYTCTMHFNQSFDEFSSLDEQNPRDKRVILREYEDETAEVEREAAGIDK